MADEWWSASRRSHGTSACPAACGWTSPAAESTSSITFQDPHRSSNTSHQPSSDAVSSLGDPHLDWTHAFLSGRSDASFQPALQNQDDMAASTTTRPLFRAHQPAAIDTVMNNPFTDMSHGLGLLDQLPASSSPCGTAPLQSMFENSAAATAAAHNVSMFRECQSSASYDASAAGMQMQGGGAQLQYLPGPGSYMPFSGAALSSHLLLQALQPKNSYSSNPNNLMVKSTEHACSPAGRKTESDSSAAAKRPRIEAPSPLPLFKVRKEKLGDRITALQQLVSPFGKTDTASVLHEANEYIKFLHDQVASLTYPYLKNANPMQRFEQKGSENAKNDSGEPKKDLRSRGLCLVPVATTYTVASETVPEFWYPTFGGTFR